MSHTVKTNTTRGIMAGAGAHLIWGFLPILWNNLTCTPLALIAWRITGCAVLAWLTVLIRPRPLHGRSLSAKTWIMMAAAALFLAGNWGMFIQAVATGRILEASLAYYINPLINVVLGVLFFSERLGRLRKMAVGLALAAVILMTLDAGVIPWFSVLLALLFGLYGMVVKKLPPELDSMEILAWETMFLFPLSVSYLIFFRIPVPNESSPFLLLPVAGAATLIPLWFFCIGARNLSLSAMGFLQFTAPTTMLLLGVLVYGESFGPLRAVAFGVVALALGLYSVTLKD